MYGCSPCDLCRSAWPRRGRPRAAGRSGRSRGRRRPGGVGRGRRLEPLRPRRRSLRLGLRRTEGRVPRLGRALAARPQPAAGPALEHRQALPRRARGRRRAGRADALPRAGRGVRGACRPLRRQAGFLRRRPRLGPLRAGGGGRGGGTRRGGPRRGEGVGGAAAHRRGRACRRDRAGLPRGQLLARRPQARLPAAGRAGRARALPRGGSRAGGTVGNRPARGRSGACSRSFRGVSLRTRGPRPRPRAARARVRAGRALALPSLQRRLGRPPRRADRRYGRQLDVVLALLALRGLVVRLLPALAFFGRAGGRARLVAVDLALRRVAAALVDLLFAALLLLLGHVAPPSSFEAAAKRRLPSWVGVRAFPPRLEGETSVTLGRWSRSWTDGAARSAACGSRSPTAATSGAATACQPRVWSGWSGTSC